MRPPKKTKVKQQQQKLDKSQKKTKKLEESTKKEELKLEEPYGPASTADDYSFRELLLIKQGYYKTEVPKQIVQKKQEIQVIEKKLKAMPRHRLYLHEIKELEGQLMTLHEAVNRLENGVEQAEYCHRLRQLMRSLESIQPAAEWRKHVHTDDFKRTAKQLYVAEFFPDLTVPTFVHKDHCADCGHPLLLNKRHALLECTQCGLSTVYINTTNSAVSWSQTPPLQKHEYNQMKWMYKQLSQYRIGSRKIPVHVIYAVKRRLLSSHQKTSQTVTHTPIRECLKVLGYREYSNCASKIADIINCKTVAEFTDSQFIRVIERVLAIQMVYFMVRSTTLRSNFPNLNFSLKQICIFEGWWELSTCFSNQKTARVFAQQTREWAQFLPYLQQYDPKHSWVYPASHPHLAHLNLIRR